MKMTFGQPTFCKNGCAKNCCNMKRIRLIAIGLTFVIFAVAILSQRVWIAELVRGLNAPALPEAVSYQDVAGETTQPEAVLDEPAEDRVDEDETAPSTSAGDNEDLEEKSTNAEPTPVSEPGGEPQPKADQPSAEELELPLTFNLAVPFTSQAPHSNWDLPYQEACEEASVYMVHEYYEDTPEGAINADVADAELLRIVEFEESLFGFFKDTTADQTAIFTSQLYGYSRVDVIENPTVQDIKAHIAAGRPVIVPAAGQQLGNPYFTQPGPLYHMLVVRGYTQTGFITNDPGTRHGEGYVYRFDVLMRAMHDWNGGDVQNGKKVILVIYPEE